ncbi:hypothetical protein AB1Y20_016162 [Prymnesium parvum]|uniref:Fe2OG dioxygenase domain-containing protein n=1 Tax=Prymnesium parvum TaxID=97485 RepID=A0AB34K296_PRYPA
MEALEAHPQLQHAPLHEALSMERQPLLAWLKEQGVSNVAERQRLAGAVARARREGAAERDAEPVAALPPCDGRRWEVWHAASASWRPRRTGLAPLDEVMNGGEGDVAGSPLVLDGVMSEGECAQLVARAEATGFRGTASRGGRSGARKCTLADGALAAELFARVRPRLPECVAVGAVGLWESFRIHSYSEGDAYEAHRDNCCKVGDSCFFPDCRSALSLLLYLKDSSDGYGATRFHLRPGDTPILRDVVPRAGRVVLFAHGVLHESLPAGECRKYIARSDVLFSPAHSSLCDDLLRAAML